MFLESFVLKKPINFQEVDGDRLFYNKLIVLLYVNLFLPIAKLKRTHKPQITHRKWASARNFYTVANRLFPHFCKLMHQLEVWVEKSQ